MRAFSVIKINAEKLTIHSEAGLIRILRWPGREA
jgi:hypothetical protein